MIKTRLLIDIYLWYIPINLILIQLTVTLQVAYETLPFDKKKKHNLATQIKLKK